MLYFIAFCWIYVTNLLGLLIQTPLLSNDLKFTKWSSKHLIFYPILSIISLLSSYKLKLLLFTRLFTFRIFRAQLQNIQKFRIFNMMSFIGIGHEGMVFYATFIVLTKYSVINSVFLMLLDVVIVGVLNLILAFGVSKKNENFFE